MPSSPSQSLELAVIGNSRIGALIDEQARIVWMCVPRFDGDPVFNSLMNGEQSRSGSFDISLQNAVSCTQQYLRNTPILRSEFTDDQGGRVEVIDFAPRFSQHGRTYAPVGIVRIVRRLAGRPRIVVRFAPTCDYGAKECPITYGSHHIRAQVPTYPLRLTTDAAITHVIEQRPILVEDTLSFILGPDETLQDAPRETCRHMLEQTQRYWLRWVRNLAVPLDWQDAVIRAAITLKLNTFDDTGAIIAALTTSIPEAPHTQRNWDYRFCWLRDAYFVVNALNRLGATDSLERYLHYIEHLIAEADGHRLQPVYALNGAAALHETEAAGLSGYRGMGPVRVGNDAYRQVQNDVYGSVILAVSHAFYDQRLERMGDAALFAQLEALGERAFAVYAERDAGIWEFRGRAEVHTFSALMCWAACDRLARIATHIRRHDRVPYWSERAAQIRAVIEAKGWNNELKTFTASFGGDTVDASLLLLQELNFLSRNDPRLKQTVNAIEQRLRRGDFLLRYDTPDDFGMPDTAFLVCTFWWIQALAAMGETQRAREEFERVLASRNRFGLLSEDIATESHELWGNFPQTYSMVGIIMCAMQLSRRWEDVV